MSSRSSRRSAPGAPSRTGAPSHEARASHAHPRQHAAGVEADAGDHGYDRPSKSQLKREMTELQKLGVQLLELPPAKLRDLPIPEELIEAIALAQKIRNSREGHRRQRQYIGRLMRDIDPEPIRDALSMHGARHRAEVAAMHTAEHWRERLLADPKALAEFSGLYPNAGDSLPALLDAARAELASGQPGRRIRELFRALRDAVTAQSAASPAAIQETKGTE